MAQTPKSPIAFLHDHPNTLSHPATWVIEVAAAASRDLVSSPEAGPANSGLEYNFARAFVAQADGDVTIRPVGGATGDQVTITCVGGIVYPICFDYITAAAVAVTVMF